MSSASLLPLPSAPGRPYLPSMSTARESHPSVLREEAFDLYIAGYGRARLTEELRDRHGPAAPSESTLKNWSVRDRWPLRRRRIRRLLRDRADALRALAGPELASELLKLRRVAVEGAGETPFHSAEGAFYSLAALERVIARHEDREADHALRDHRRSIGALISLLETNGQVEPDHLTDDEQSGRVPTPREARG